jgi:hypothetical protein
VLQAPLLFIQVHVRKGLCAGKSAEANAQQHKGKKNAQEEPSAQQRAQASTIIWLWIKGACAAQEVVV